MQTVLAFAKSGLKMETLVYGPYASERGAIEATEHIQAYLGDRYTLQVQQMDLTPTAAPVPDVPSFVREVANDVMSNHPEHLWVKSVSKTIHQDGAIEVRTTLINDAVVSILITA